MIYVILDGDFENLYAKLPQPIDTYSAECAVVQCTLPPEAKYIAADFIQASTFNNSSERIIFSNTEYNPEPVYHKIRFPSLESIRLEILSDTPLSTTDKIVVVLHIRNYY